jgi:ACS family hexuronate transporter-like MFS transporter
MSIAIGILMLTASAYWALIQDTVPSYYVGPAGGLMHGMGNCAGLFAPTLTGFIIQETGTYGVAFVVTGVLGVAGALAVWLFFSEPSVSTDTGAVARLSRSILRLWRAFLAAPY